MLPTFPQAIASTKTASESMLLNSCFTFVDLTNVSQALIGVQEWQINRCFHYRTGKDGKEIHKDTSENNYSFGEKA